VHTIESARRRFPAAPLRIIAPAFDSDGPLNEIAQRFDGDVQVLYGFDASPLDRMLMATQELADEAFVLRADGLHFPADFELAGSMLARARRSALDGIKTPDDFPTQLSVDVLRVGALRRARTLIDDDASPFLVHPKFLLATHPSFQFARQEDLPTYSDEWLTTVRDKATIMLGDVQRDEIGGRWRIPQGDQLGYHYELALRHLHPGDRVLDVACGDGFGVRMIAQRCANVVGVDIDAPSIAAARRATGGSFVVADATRMPFEDGYFQAVVSFETLEHVPVDPFMREVRRVLAPGGVLLLSTPQNRLGHIPLVPVHEHEFPLAKLTQIVSAHFEVLERIGLKAGTIWFDGDPVGSNSFFVCRR
jgi:SAM-dependent methyltransferase